MADAIDVDLHASGVETTSGQGGAVDIGELRTAVELDMRVTDITGTNSALSVTVETSTIDDDGWRFVGYFPTVSTRGLTRRCFDDLDRFVRLNWTIGGASPSVTFAASGEAHVLLATWQDVIESSIPENALASIERHIRARHLLQATEKAYGRISRAFPPPLTAWGHDVRSYTATLAAVAMMFHRGVAPDGADALALQMLVRDAEKALDAIGRSEVRPTSLQPATPAGPRTSSGNPDAPGAFRSRFSDDWGDFG